MKCKKDNGCIIACIETCPFGLDCPRRVTVRGMSVKVVDMSDMVLNVPNVDSVINISLKQHDTFFLVNQCSKSTKICILCSCVVLYPFVYGIGIRIHKFKYLLIMTRLVLSSGHHSTCSNLCFIDANESINDALKMMSRFEVFC